jgi:hypothetical protein
LENVRWYALLTIPLTIMMIVERLTGRDLFYVLGGVSEFDYYVRNGTARAQGPFRGPIMAGSFGAALVPLFCMLWWYRRGRYRWLALLGMASATTVVLASHSSGPAMAFLAGVVGLAAWQARHSMAWIRRGIVGMFVFLAVVMKAPVWYVITRFGVISGSDGWHRAFLIDRTIANFSDWWLIGTKSTESWGLLLQDITNEYVMQGAEGGLLAVVLFVFIIICAYRCVGMAVKASNEYEYKRMIWCLGCSLLAHTVSYISVSYFDQNFINWYMLLAVITTVTQAKLTVASSAYRQTLFLPKTGRYVSIAAEPAHHSLLLK